MEEHGCAGMISVAPSEGTAKYAHRHFTGSVFMDNSLRHKIMVDNGLAWHKKSYTSGKKNYCSYSNIPRRHSFCSFSLRDGALVKPSSYGLSISKLNLLEKNIL